MKKILLGLTVATLTFSTAHAQRKAVEKRNNAVEAMRSPELMAKKSQEAMQQYNSAANNVKSFKDQRVVKALEGMRGVVTKSGSISVKGLTNQVKATITESNLGESFTTLLGTKELSKGAFARQLKSNLENAKNSYLVAFLAEAIATLRSPELIAELEAANEVRGESKDAKKFLEEAVLALTLELGSTNNVPNFASTTPANVYSNGLAMVYANKGYGPLEVARTFENLDGIIAGMQMVRSSVEAGQHSSLEAARKAELPKILGENIAERAGNCG
ncbi:MAG: hypothetical protein VX583_14720 [Bdellovibrionota bacterium]|nr:hypothetical protein [Pseudobdellovibrionaceae bacterium]|tara:strand:- start:35612 stop:36433 length:822 start_codon:yes stop_codon:yes gene_type:complete